MFINSLNHYIPELRISNSYFENINGLTEDWILQRTGIKTRSWAGQGENTNTMGIKACESAAEHLPYPISEVDLIVGGTYTPFDTVGTLAHSVQRHFKISGAKVFTMSSACSSFVNALEIAEGYFAMGKASKALIVASEHNTAYHNPSDSVAGHLWGDGAAAVFVSKERISENDMEIADIITYGHAEEGQGPEGVMLHPWDGGIKMPFGKDVFIHAVKHMRLRVEELLERNGYTLNDISFLIPHQANTRIMDNVAENLGVPKEKVFVNISELGNTGCPSSAIALSQNLDRIKKGDILALTVFGGGYSSGALLLKA